MSAVDWCEDPAVMTVDAEIVNDGLAPAARGNADEGNVGAHRFVLAAARFTVSAEVGDASGELRACRLLPRFW